MEPRDSVGLLLDEGDSVEETVGKPPSVVVTVEVTEENAAERGSLHRRRAGGCSSSESNEVASVVLFELLEVSVGLPRLELRSPSGDTVDEKVRCCVKSGQTELAIDVATPTVSKVGDSPMPSSVS